MKKLLSCIILMLSMTAFLPAQEYARVKVLLHGEHAKSLAELGVETDHGDLNPGVHFTTDLSYKEIELVQSAGYSTQILIDSVELWYARRSANLSVQSRGDDNCGEGQVLDIGPYPTPANYTYGSMGGYHTYAELLAVLDDMHQKYPSLITARRTISDNLKTHEGRPLYWLRVSKNAETDEAEPEVLYTALHHSREPNGLSQMIFYLWYLLENYDSKPEIAFLLDHCELYFIPCINPDGYIYNELTNPQGGGLWRKNRRINGDGVFGVDLNRNYGFQWGFDNEGSSPNYESSAYRGPAPFSEPETRLVRDFCLAHDFKTALNYHTFSNLLIYPWAYDDNVANTDQAALAKMLVLENQYRAGTVGETVGYPVNGSSDDWMLSQKEIFAYTPEIGSINEGFWPAIGDIDRLNKENMWANLTLAWSQLKLGVVEELTEDEMDESPILVVRTTRYGLQEGPLTVTVNPLTPNITQITPNSNVLNLAHLQSATFASEIQVDNSIQFGDLIVFEITVDNGDFILRDTITKIWYGGLRTEAFAESLTPESQWEGNWSFTNSTFVTAPTSMTDSPNALYAPNTVSAMQTKEAITIPIHALIPRLHFYARWHLEDDYDWVQLEAISKTTGESTILCGRFSQPGSDNQIPNQPIWEGFRPTWLEECIDLSALKNDPFYLQFTLVSDQEINLDGFYVDDLSVDYIDTTISSIGYVKDDLYKVQIRPNPATNQVQIQWPEQLSPDHILVTNTLGATIASFPIQSNTNGRFDLNTSNWPSGTYFVQLQGSDALFEPKRLVIFR